MIKYQINADDTSQLTVIVDPQFVKWGILEKSAWLGHNTRVIGAVAHLTCSFRAIAKVSQCIQLTISRRFVRGFVFIILLFRFNYFYFTLFTRHSNFYFVTYRKVPTTRVMRPVGLIMTLRIPRVLQRITMGTRQTIQSRHIVVQLQ